MQITWPRFFIWSSSPPHFLESFESNWWNRKNTRGHDTHQQSPLTLYGPPIWDRCPQLRPCIDLTFPRLQVVPAGEYRVTLKIRYRSGLRIRCYLKQSTTQMFFDLLQYNYPRWPRMRTSQQGPVPDWSVPPQIPLISSYISVYICVLLQLTSPKQITSNVNDINLRCVGAVLPQHAPTSVMTNNPSLTTTNTI